AVDRAQHAAVLKPSWKRLAPAAVAFELELHQTKERDRQRRRGLDVDAEVTDVARDNGGEARRAALVLPRQAGGQLDVAAVGRAFVAVGLLGRLRLGLLRRFGVRPDVLHDGLQGVLTDLSNAAPIAAVCSPKVGPGT